MDKISLKAYSSPSIRNDCNMSNVFFDVTIPMSKDVEIVLKHLKNEFSRLQKWSNGRLLAFLVKKIEL